VEKVVELKTVFEISYGDDRAAGFGKARWRSLKPWIVTSYAIHRTLTWPGA